MSDAPAASPLAGLLVRLSAARTELGDLLETHLYPHRYLLGSAVDALKSAIKIIDHVEYDCAANRPQVAGDASGRPRS